MVSWQFFVTFLGWLSDLQLGDQKVALNHLLRHFFREMIFFGSQQRLGGLKDMEFAKKSVVESSHLTLGSVTFD